jgi:DMSO/TMAO reductase YedYZ molybdopterin-dependent catalytic subunit
MSLFSSSEKKSSRPAELADRVPPGQYLTKGFPVLTYGPTPRVEKEEFRLKNIGLVEREVEFDWDALLAMPQTTVTRDIHCVTTWSKLDTTWTGVLFRDYLKQVPVKPEAKFVVQHSYGGYTTNLPLEAMLGDDVLIAHAFDGQPIDREHGGPIRMVVPKLYFWKSAKWLAGFEFLAVDKLGFWERNGYSNSADPWKEERFTANNRL